MYLEFSLFNDSVYQPLLSMGRKLQGRKSANKTKGLKGALLRHEAHEKLKQNESKTLEVQKQKQEEKQSSMKSGGSKKKAQSKQQIQHQQKGLIPFKPDATLLLVGEGDFSFARSLVQENLILPENLVATSFDSKEEVVSKYPGVEEIMNFLESEGVNVIHEVDATDLVTSLKLKPNSKTKQKPNRILPAGKKLNYIMFNFPHTGRGMKDVDRNIRDHQKLVLNYFKSCKDLFSLANNSAKDDFAGYSTAITSDEAREGKIILSLFEGEPYASWNIKILGRSEGFRVERSGKFDWLSFPGYHHKRTNGIRDTTKPAAEREARVYVFDKFVPKDQQKLKPENNDSDSD